MGEAAEPGLPRGVAPALAPSRRAPRADGVFINYGLAADNVAESEGAVAWRPRRRRAGDPDEVEIWQIACLDCNEDGEAARRKIGAILAFVPAYVMGGDDLARPRRAAEHARRSASCAAGTARVPATRTRRS